MLRPERRPLVENDTYLLRLPERKDFGQWAALRTISRNFLEPWEPAWNNADFTERSFHSRVDRNMAEFTNGQAIALFIFRKSDMALLGGITIGLIRRGVAQNCMIGYWMGEKHAGQGHMFAALGMVIQYIFSELRLHRIEAACIPENQRSIRLLEKSGFKREGLLRAYLKINGRWQDHVMFSLLESDRRTAEAMSTS
ncbi:GNAT family N-acetyltransferase [Rhizobium sp. PAMB 3182]